jgi:N-methylhydantoinase B
LTAQKVAGAIFGAFRGILPESRIMASSNDVCPAIVFSGRLEHRPGEFVYLETVAGGAGARADLDGMDGVHVHMTNSSNLPIEALENEYPLRVDEYAFVPESGGVGHRRGGMAIARQISSLADDIVFSARSDNHTAGHSAGVLGGGDGRQSRLLHISRDGAEQPLSSKTASMQLGRGESIRIETSGAGGYGLPADRPVDALLQDLENEVIGISAARQAYGSLADEALARLASRPELRPAHP